MATVYVTAAPAGQKQTDISFGPARSETITSSGTAAQGSLVAKSQEAFTIFVSTAVYAQVGPNPTASPTAGYYVPAGVPKDIMASKGDIVSVIDV